MKLMLAKRKEQNSLRYFWWVVAVCLAALYNIAVAQGARYVRGDLSHPNGCEDCNPCVKDVVYSIYTLQNRGESLGFNWPTHFPKPAGAGSKSHWQGIQRLPVMDLYHPYLAVSLSNRISRSLTQKLDVRGPALLVVVEMASRKNDGGRLYSNRLALTKRSRHVPPDIADRIVTIQRITEEFNHPGGLQTLGQYLLVGADGNVGHSRKTAVFTLWDMSDPVSPREVWQPHWELAKGNANSVGISKLGDGRYLMVRALRDGKKLEFYLLGTDIEKSPTAHDDDILWDRWDPGELQSQLTKIDGSPDRSWGDFGGGIGQAGYQNTNIVKECGTGELYLIATHGRRPSGGGSDVIEVYRLEIPTKRPDPDKPGDGVVITKVARRTLFPSGNAGARQGDLQAAAGVYISPHNKLYLYATEHGVTGKAGKSGQKTFVKLIQFEPEEPLSRVETLDEAWVRLYDRNNYKGRFITLDYEDRELRNYANFKHVEEFNDRASSILYAIPKNHRVRLYADTQFEGGYLNLVGTGHVQRIAALSGSAFSDGEECDDEISSAEWQENRVAGQRQQ